MEDYYSYYINLFLGIFSGIVLTLISLKFSTSLQYMSQRINIIFIVGIMAILSVYIIIWNIFLSLLILTIIFLSNYKKNNISKLSVSAFFAGLLFFLFVQSIIHVDVLFIADQVFRDNNIEFNTLETDIPILQVRNVTRDSPLQNPFYWSVAIKADEGDTLEFCITYHNTGDVKATNVKMLLLINNTIRKYKKQIVRNYIRSSNSRRTYHSDVSIHFAKDSMALAYLSSTWYRYAREPQKLLYNQKGVEILEDGLDIGSVEAAWNKYGKLYVKLLVKRE